MEIIKYFITTLTQKRGPSKMDMKRQFEQGMYQIRKNTENVTFDDINWKVMQIDERNKWSKTMICYIVNNGPYLGVLNAKILTIFGSKYKFRDNLSVLVAQGLVETKGHLLLLTDNAKVRSGLFVEKYVESEEEFRRLSLGIDNVEPLVEEASHDVTNSPKEPEEDEEIVSNTTKIE